MNGLLGSAYFTIHVTPESHCSYASFETNVQLVSYRAVVEHMLRVLKPKRFTMTVFADEEGLKQMENPVDISHFSVENLGYRRLSKSLAFWGEDGEDYICSMGNYEIRQGVAPLVLSKVPQQTLEQEAQR